MMLEEDVFLFRGSNKVVGEEVEGRSLKGDGSVVLKQVFEAGKGMVIEQVCFD